MARNLRSLFFFFIFSIFYAIALDNGLVRTPPMGWMSWTKFLCQTDCVQHPFSCISEQLYMDMAELLVKDGYADAGYNFIHIDDCWMAHQRDSNNRLVADPIRFPSGIAFLTDFMHRRGLKLGIYADYGLQTCAGYPGSYGYLKIDADTFASWNVDYLKLDGCYIGRDEIAKGYINMSHFLNATSRPIVFSCSWPAYLIDHPEMVDYNVIGNVCNLWRNFDDISLSWDSIMSIIKYYDQNQDKHIPINGPGKWHDPDMLIVGNDEITVDQAKVQMSIWSIWSAPLIMSNDLRLIAPVYREVLLNKKVIAINQDPLGIMGRLVASTSNIGVYVKPVIPMDKASNLSSFAIAVFNRNSTYQLDVEFQLYRIGLKNEAGYFVEDLWSGEVKGIFKPNDVYKTRVNSTGVDFFKATYLSSKKA